MSGRLRRRNNYQIAQWSGLKYCDSRLASVRKRVSAFDFATFSCIINKGDDDVCIARITRVSRVMNFTS